MRIELAGLLLAATVLTSSAAAAKDRDSVVDFMGPILAAAPDAATITAQCDRYVAEINRRVTELESETGPATVDTTLVRFDQIGALLNGGSGEFTLYQQVMADDARRDAGGDCQVRLAGLSSKIGLSRRSMTG